MAVPFGLIDAAMESNRIFLLSPANCGGLRAQLLLNEKATFDMATRLRVTPGPPLGEVFSFLSGLYFRGKMAYARAFARPPASLEGALVITPNRGLVSAVQPVSLADLRQFAEVDIHEDDPRYRQPLERDAARIAEQTGDACEVVLLGSIATGKYLDVLLATFGDRLRFPREFVGRGDMSRGGLMLRRAASGEELEYIPVAGAVRRGRRPAKLPKLTR